MAICPHCLRDIEKPPRRKPASCVCVDSDWKKEYSEIPAVCKNFEQWLDYEPEDICKHCQHLEACHQ